jgi:hypothetical protein
MSDHDGLGAIRESAVAHATDGDLLQANATYRQLNATS